MNASLTDILTFLSVLVAIIFGVIGFLQNRSAQKKSYTVSLLENFSTNETLAASGFIMTKLIKDNRKLDGDKIDENTDQHVINLLNYYEFLATSYVHGALNREILLHVRGGSMSRAFFVCEKYIEDRRKMLDAPNLYINYQNLVMEYRELNMGY